MIKIVFADKDEKYLLPLEMKFIENYGEKIEIEVITDAGYMAGYFSEPKMIDILVISEDLYYRELNRHEIRQIFIVSENQAGSETEKPAENTVWLYKYLGVRDTCSMIMESVPEIAEKLQQDLSMLLTVCPAGGSAQSSLISCAAALCLAKSSFKVLYISTDAVQGFSCLLKQSGAGKCSIKELLEADDSRFEEVLRKQASSESFDYLLAPAAVPANAESHLQDYTRLILRIKKSAVYDYIVAETSSELSKTKTDLLNASDKIMLFSENDDLSLFRLEKFMQLSGLAADSKKVTVCRGYENSSDAAADAGLNDRMQELADTESFRRLVFDII